MRPPERCVRLDGMPYNPPHDVVTDVETIAAFVEKHPLATLITHDGVTPQADMVPLLLVDDDDAPTGKALIGHVARANPLWQNGRHEGLTLVTFGPLEHYVSPSWYPSKAEHHRVVPTWNYLVAHAWGELEVHDDPRWVRGVVAKLTGAMEGGRDEPWRMGQAPRDYLDDMLTKIVGIRISVQRMEARFKVSSHRSDADRLGARDGIATELDGRGAAELADAMGESSSSQTSSMPVVNDARMTS